MTNRNELTETTQETIFSDSLKLAELVNKPHYDTLKFIRNLMEQNVTKESSLHQTNRVSKIEETFLHLEKHVISSFYYDSRNRLKPKYNLTKEGFTVLFNHLSGKSATQARIKVSDRYETELNRAKEARSNREQPPVHPLLPRPPLTQKQIHDWGVDKTGTPCPATQVRRTGGFIHNGKFIRATINPPKPLPEPFPESFWEGLK